MGFRERLTQVSQFFRRARTEGRQLMDEDARRASSPDDQNSQREERRLGGMTAEDRASEQGSLQRNRDRQAQSGAAKTAADE